MTYYKVLVKYKNKLYSYIATGRIMRRTYSTKRWTRPHKALLELGYGLCVFETRDDVVSFVRCNYETGEADVRVFTCETGRCWKPRVSNLYYAIQTLDRFVYEYENDTRWSGMPSPFSYGTTMTDKVKLLTDITDEILQSW